MFQWVAFGKVKYDGAVFNEDVVISTSGDVYARPYRDYMAITAEDLEACLDSNAEALIVGTGHYGTVAVTIEARKLLRSKGIELTTKESPKAVELYNKRLSGRGKKPKTNAIICVK